MDIAHTPRLRLREVDPGDARFICQLLNDPDWLRNIGDRGIRTAAEAEGYIRDKIMSAYAVHGFGMYLMQLADGRPIGLCGLVKRDALPIPDLGFALLAPHRRHGYAHEAAQAVLQRARDILKLPQLLAIVNPHNHASARLLERLGFLRRGTHRPAHEALDLHLYRVDL